MGSNQPQGGVHFDSDELIGECVPTLDSHLRVSPLQFTVQRDETSVEQVRGGTAFELKESDPESHRASVHSQVRYDLIGKLSEQPT